MKTALCVSFHVRVNSSCQPVRSSQELEGGLMNLAAGEWVLPGGSFFPAADVPSSASSLRDHPRIRVDARRRPPFTLAPAGRDPFFA